VGRRSSSPISKPAARMTALQSELKNRLRLILHLFNFVTFLTLLTSHPFTAPTLQRFNLSTLQRTHGAQPHPSFHCRRNFGARVASGFPAASSRPARPSRRCSDRIRFGVAPRASHCGLASCDCLVRSFGRACFSPEPRPLRTPPLPPARLGPPVRLWPPVRYYRLACRSRANHRQRCRLRSRTSRRRLNQSRHTASPRRARHQFCDLSTPILATPCRTFSPLRTNSHFL